MNALRVVFVHGISPSVIDYDYSAKLASKIVDKLTQYGVVPENATREQLDEIITFDQVNYSTIGHQEEERLFQAYEQETAKLYNFVYRLSRAAGLDKVRRQIITSVADVMVYKSDYWGHMIRGMVAEKIEPYVESNDAVSIVAHSLGSVVSFDTIYYNATANEKWRAAGFRPVNLFTMGSPIALFSLDLDRETGQQPVRYVPGPTPETPDIPDSPALHLLRPEGVWYNFLDAQDIIAYPLQILFEGNFPVEDIVVQTGTNPRKAHDGYWNNDEVAEVIANRLKMDFQRINTREVAPVAKEPAGYVPQA